MWAVSKPAPIALLLSMGILLSLPVSAQEARDVGERVGDDLTSDGVLTPEELEALGDLSGPAPTILSSVLAQERLAEELAAREDALSQLDPVRFEDPSANRGYDLAAAVAAGLGITSFVVQNVFARLSNAELAQYDESNDPLDLQSARANAARSLVAAGIGIVGLGVTVPFIAFGDRTEAPIADVPPELADLWWSSDSDAQAAQLRLVRSRAARRLEVARSTSRGYTIGTIAAGGASLAAGIVATIAVARGNELYELYRAATFSSDAERYRREVETQRTIALMSGTVGTASIGSMIALLLTRPKPEEIQGEIEAITTRIERLESVE